MTYVDGFVIPIKKSKLSAYKKMAILGGKSWMKHGALQYWECVGEELKVTDPATKKKTSPFPAKFGLKPSETVLFSWIVFKDKAHRNKVNAKVMKEMEKSMKDFDMKDMPFDMKKVLYAGFTPIVKMKK
ncbi:MAG TPA: DUF1428 domain-containing protein [archaeon]|nr:DUF1428 domain-containing protein [archaeon]